MQASEIQHSNSFLFGGGGDDYLDCIQLHSITTILMHSLKTYVCVVTVR